LLFHRIK